MNNLRYLPLAFFLLFPAAARADDCARYADTVFNYSVCLPRGWKKTYEDAGDRHYLALRPVRAAGVDITVTASRFDGDGKLDLDAWRKGRARAIGGRVLKIIETREMAAGSGITVKYFVFDYYFRGTRMLQRTMLSKYGDRLLVIECRAPLGSFARHTDSFNLVMSGVDYTGTMTADAMETLEVKKTIVPKKEKDVMRKQAAPEKKAGPEKKADIAQPGEQTRDSSPVKPGEEKPDAAVNHKQETMPETMVKKGEDVDLDLENVEDPEARKEIESELDTLQDMEKRGIIEKLED